MFTWKDKYQREVEEWIPAFTAITSIWFQTTTRRYRKHHEHLFYPALRTDPSSHEDMGQFRPYFPFFQEVSWCRTQVQNWRIRWFFNMEHVRLLILYPTCKPLDPQWSSNNLVTKTKKGFDFVRSIVGTQHSGKSLSQKNYTSPLMPKWKLREEYWISKLLGF